MWRRWNRPSVPSRAGGGFTLLELLVGLMVLSTGVVALLWTMSHEVRSLSEHHQNLLARAAVMRQLEYVRTAAFAQLVTGMPFQDADGNGIGDGLEELAGASGTLSVCDYNPSALGEGGGLQPRCDGSANTQIKQVTVTVTLSTGRAWRAATLVSQ